MEDAGRAIKRVREELAKKDKANGTSVSESLDLANLVKKIDRGFFDAPAPAPWMLFRSRHSWRWRRLAERWNLFPWTYPFVPEPRVV